MKPKISAGTVARTLVLVLTLVNMVLTALGKNPLPFSGGEVYTAVSSAAVVAAAIAAWWKNNSFTEKAIEAQGYLIESKTENEPAREEDAADGA